jgi:hypothetical protein
LREKGEGSANVSAKFRSRRELETVEVLNAPFYSQAIENEVKITTPDPSSHAALSAGLLGSATNTTPKRPGEVGFKKRRRTTTTVTTGEADEGQRAAKRSKGRTAGHDQGKMHGGRKRQSAQQDGKGQPEGLDENLFQTVARLGLIPDKLLSKRTAASRFRDPRKLDAAVGRRQNPGLSSLPSNSNKPSRKYGSGDSTAAFEIEFLDPVTRDHLDELPDGDYEADEDVDEIADGDDIDITSSFAGKEGQSRTVDKVRKAQEGKGVVNTEKNREVVEMQNFQQVNGGKFTETTVLKGFSNGSWPRLGDDYFQKYQTSFTLHGFMPRTRSLLADSIPCTVEEMALLGRGPYHAPTNEPGWYADWMQFCYYVESMQSWESSREGAKTFSSYSFAPDYRFFNLHPPASVQHTAVGRVWWHNENQMTLETLPYNDLESMREDGEDDWWEETGAQQRTTSRSVMTSQARDKRVSSPRRRGLLGKMRLHNYKVDRDMTAYPRPNEYLRNEGDRSEGLDWGSKTVLLTAFVVVSTLLGGLSKLPDWGLLMRLFPEMTVSTLRAFWRDARREQKSTVDYVTRKFRAAFLEAYEKEELPGLDFERPLDYDWKSLVGWAMRLDTQNTQLARLPASHAGFQGRYMLTDNTVDRPWRETFNELARSNAKRFMGLTSESMAVPIDRPRGRVGSFQTASIDPFTVATSWNRALCVTPVQGGRDAELVADKLETLTATVGIRADEATELLTQANQKLRSTGVLTRSNPKNNNGRVWRLNNKVFDVLEKGAHLERFAQAAAAKRLLDAAFARGEIVRHRYYENDGVTLAVLNLQACGRVRVEMTGRRDVPLGFEPGNYETRKFPKKYQHFRIHVVPTAEYLYDDGEQEDGVDDEEEALEPRADLPETQKNNGIEENYEHRRSKENRDRKENQISKKTKRNANELSDLRARIRAAAPPTRGALGAIPLWCDLFGTLDGERWLLYLGTVLYVLAARGAMRADDLARAFKTSLMPFEADMILDFGRRVGVLAPQFPGGPLAAAEWWWLVVELQRDRLRDEAMVTPVPRTRRPLPSARRVTFVDAMDG